MSPPVCATEDRATNGSAAAAFAAGSPCVRCTPGTRSATGRDAAAAGNRAAVGAAGADEGVNSSADVGGISYDGMPSGGMCETCAAGYASAVSISLDLPSITLDLPPISPRSPPDLFRDLRSISPGSARVRPSRTASTPTRRWLCEVPGSLS